MHDKIQNQIYQATMARDQVRLDTLRSILAAFINESVALGRTPKDKLSDTETMPVIKRLVKQRRDSIEQFKKGNRMDLVENEEDELQVLEEFLPAQMSEEDIKKIAQKIIKQSKDEKNTGKLVGMVMKETKGEADGNTIKKIVGKLLS